MSQYRNKEVLQVLGKNIEYIRKKRKLTIKECAALAQYNRNSLSRLECGEQDVQLSTVIKLASVLNVFMPDLFSRELMSTEIIKPFRVDDYLLVFSTNVESVFKEKGKYALSVYSEVNMDPATISRILRQNVKNPRITTLMTIASCASKNLTELFSRT